MTAPLPDQMRCVEIAGAGGPEVLKMAARPLPVPGDGEVLIAVAAAGVNRPDVFQRQGSYPPPPGASDLPGLEVAGTIVAIGAKAGEGWRIGDRVCALLSGGGYAQYASADAALCMPVPQTLGLDEAAALPETFFTVWHNLFQRARLQEGESLLVHGGSSGIGTTAIQMAKAFGVTVYVTAGTPEKCAACEALGADRAINYRTEDYPTVIKELTGGRGVDVVLDMVGGDYIDRDLRILAEDGRHVNIAFLQGSKVTVDLMRMMLKRLTLTGSTLRSRPATVKAGIARALEEKVWPLLEQGKLRPPIHARFALEDAAEAHRLMERSDHIGKIVLTL
ncbi:NAD(P)H-quinone oxidoreductase [Rhodospirillum rubrum]|uniref:Zinc-containing alcohol dehydrogenase superfamily n=1 Tax=Rhodospirillum rubrum (strain ATCC 11170 / ATH 1.1.1 / DSM 467 / LMG 4362 / NCIMB 8255 / S1) TaxID=269796 RepID=Q2RVI8_RHORT|nr:NAD(P)H-quinone oxidoreductase [Rhodospirillum rubrum]ABC21857.1 Zinc-containing alcohol dehydrogenase superfamily [Rhodospirillum rubrum ATCC 11170]AEO47558.1 zinc-containing alcohol dehydrogenase superfamily protein [Rhodospirillum rubrum F11]MBK5953420.1 NAD(P)H-quinone oxidoreductase [Rhodospirillum rubrum]QXG81517.1 NAD(P)H-quinone oxidoreductase [Rhodospirillum rubrum]HAQ01305.1 NAD(P)H-quinone oxidoreductase [Rhodospirillum rubrum]